MEMDDLNTLIQAFVGQSQNPALTAPPSWQDELRNQMDPEAAKRRNISSALAAAAAAIGASRGSPLHGISQGIVAGAQKYNDGKSSDQQQRIEAMKTLSDSDLESRYKRLQLLKGAIEVQGGQEDRLYNRKKASTDAADAAEKLAYERRLDQQRLDLQAERNGILKDGQSARRAAGGETGPGGVLQPDDERPVDSNGKSVGAHNPQRDSAGRLTQKEQNRRAAIKQFYDWKKQMIESRTPPTPEEERAYKMQLLDDYGIRDLYEPAAPKKSDGTPSPSYPTSAADYLKKNPQFRDQFDAKYGEGAAASVLGQ
jgi:hypothetical protein